MDTLFEGERNVEDDFYHILGCCETSTIEQILAEYKQKALLYHPDKNPDDPSVKERFVKLQEAKETLTDPAKRRDYDMWKDSGITIPYKKWVSMRSGSTAVFHWVTTSKSQGRMLESGQSTTSSDSQKPNKQSYLSLSHPRESIIAKFRNYEI